MNTSASTDTPLLRARGISKAFAGVEVLSDVDLDLSPGEIHALLGENGAGKSTFAKVIAGVHRPTRGTLQMNGRVVEVPNPVVAQKLGVTGTVTINENNSINTQAELTTFDASNIDDFDF